MTSSADADRRPSGQAPVAAVPEDEEAWLYHHVMRLRLALRYARAHQAEAVLREMIAAAETRLDVITRARVKDAP